MIKSTDENLTRQLEKINRTLDSINFNKSRFFIYNANPAKFALYNFLAGVFHSLGSLFGTVVIAAAIIYFVSQIDLVNPIVNWFNQIMTRLDWNSFIPTTQFDSLDPQLLDQIKQLQ